MTLKRRIQRQAMCHTVQAMGDVQNMVAMTSFWFQQWLLAHAGHKSIAFEMCFCYCEEAVVVIWI